MKNTIVYSKNRMIRFVILSFILQFSTATLNNGYAGEKPAPPNLTKFLRTNLRIDPSSDRDSRFSVTTAKLNGKNISYVVYLTGNDWCGSGGCTALILQPSGIGFRVINHFTLARLPIKVLPTRTHGWQDLSMPRQGGGSVGAQTVVFRFDGAKYRLSRTLVPGDKLPGLDKAYALPLKQRGEPLVLARKL